MKPRNRQIPADLVKRFYADLEVVQSASGLPSGGCMKSASFGTTMVVVYHDQKTPDLRCGDQGNAKLKALIQSTNEVIEVFGGN